VKTSHGCVLWRRLLVDQPVGHRDNQVMEALPPLCPEPHSRGLGWRVVTALAGGTTSLGHKLVNQSASVTEATSAVAVLGSLKQVDLQNHLE